jgi:hypothetical protein
VAFLPSAGLSSSFSCYLMSCITLAVLLLSRERHGRSRADSTRQELSMKGIEASNHIISSRQLIIKYRQTPRYENSCACCPVFQGVQERRNFVPPSMLCKLFLSDYLPSPSCPCMTLCCCMNMRGVIVVTFYSVFLRLPCTVRPPICFSWPL